MSCEIIEPEPYDDGLKIEEGTTELLILDTLKKTN